MTRILGRPSAPEVETDFVRELNEADLVLLDAPRGVQSKPIAKLRDSHHALARALSAGMKPGEASLITGYSLSRISVLQGDPSFKELLEFYRGHQDTAYANLHDRMATLSMDALEELRERLDDHPEEFTPGALLEMVKTLADRTGFAPTTKSLNMNVDLNSFADKLQAARKRAERPQHNQALTIEVKQVPAPTDSSLLGREPEDQK
jgi:hypothetical protein